MIEEDFRQLLEVHLLPLISGTTLGATRQSTPRHSLAAYENPCSILLKPTRDTAYRVSLDRSQKFSPEEKQLVSLFGDEVSRVVKYSGEDFFPELMRLVPRRVIAQFLPASRGRQTLQDIVEQLEVLAAQTYEGRPVVAAIGMTGSLGYGNTKLADIWKEDFSMVLSNAYDTIYLCGSDGRAFKLAPLPEGHPTRYAPYRFSSIADWCERNARVAVVLNRQGEILVFQNKRLQFASRRGAWRYYAHDSVMSRLGQGLRTNLSHAVYESCLDVSFARTGGCLAVLRKNSRAKIRKLVAKDDMIEEAAKTRTLFMASAFNKSFQDLDRRIRQELLAMDGATILAHDGEIITAGSIINVPGGSAGGGRRAAAIQLSKLGLGIKISADGPIAGYRQEREIFSMDSKR